MTTRYVMHRIENVRASYDAGQGSWRTIYVKKRNPTPQPATGAMLVSEFASIHRMAETGVTALQAKRLATLLGRICDQLQIDLTQIIDPSELEHEYHIAPNAASTESSDSGSGDVGGVLPPALPDGEG